MMNITCIQIPFPYDKVVFRDDIDVQKFLYTHNRGGYLGSDADGDYFSPSIFDISHPNYYKSSTWMHIHAVRKVLEEYEPLFKLHLVCNQPDCETISTL